MTAVLYFAGERREPRRVKPADNQQFRVEAAAAQRFTRSLFDQYFGREELGSKVLLLLGYC